MGSPCMKGCGWFDMARTSEFVLHIVGYDTVTISPNQIIIIRISSQSKCKGNLPLSSFNFSYMDAWSQGAGQCGKFRHFMHHWLPHTHVTNCSTQSNNKSRTG